MRAPHFLTHLNVRHVMRRHTDDKIYEGGWIVDEPLEYYSAILDTVVVVPEDFTTDFASVPRLPFIFLFFGDTGQAAAVIHDYLYQITICSRKTADAVFEEALGVSGMPKWKRKMMYLGTRIGGSKVWSEYEMKNRAP